MSNLRRSLIASVLFLSLAACTGTPSTAESVNNTKPKTWYQPAKEKFEAVKPTIYEGKMPEGAEKAERIASIRSKGILNGKEIHVVVDTNIHSPQKTLPPATYFLGVAVGDPLGGDEPKLIAAFDMAKLIAGRTSKPSTVTKGWFQFEAHVRVDVNRKDGKIAESPSLILLSKDPKTYPAFEVLDVRVLDGAFLKMGVVPGTVSKKGIRFADGSDEVEVWIHSGGSYVLDVKKVTLTGSGFSLVKGSFWPDPAQNYSINANSDIPWRFSIKRAKCQGPGTLTVESADRVYPVVELAVACK